MEPNEQEYDAFDKFLEELELKLFEATQDCPTSTSSTSTSGGSSTLSW